MNLFTSSIDPNKISLTIKGLMLALLPALIYVTGVDEAQLTPLIDALVYVINVSVSLVSAWMIFYGLARKVYAGRWSAK